MSNYLGHNNNNNNNVHGTTFSLVFTYKSSHNITAISIFITEDLKGNQRW